MESSGSDLVVSVYRYTNAFDVLALAKLEKALRR